MFSLFSLSIRGVVRKNWCSPNTNMHTHKHTSCTQKGDFKNPIIQITEARNHELSFTKNCSSRFTTFESSENLLRDRFRNCWSERLDYKFIGATVTQVQFSALPIAFLLHYWLNHQLDWDFFVAIIWWTHTIQNIKHTKALDAKLKWLVKIRALCQLHF